jgi:hypothetical protein
MSDRFPNLLVGEKRVLAFRFTDELDAGETLQGTPTVSVSVLSGTDATPAAIVSGAPGVSSPDVLVTVAPAVAAVEYRIEVLIATSNTNKVLACVGQLYVA